MTSDDWRTDDKNKVSPYCDFVYYPSSREPGIQLTMRVLKPDRPCILEGMLNQYDRSSTSIQLKHSMIIVTVLPILLVYPFLQKYFVKGVMIGSLKG